jgi:hypothetical protein
MGVRGAVGLGAALVLAAVTVACAAGCGPTTAGPSSPSPTAGPSSRRPTAAPTAATSTVPAQVAAANRTHEIPTPAGRQTVIGGWRTPVQAVEVFATTYINWTAATVSARLRALAEVSVGQARSAVSLAAAETAGDAELRRGGIANSGVVEAIGPVAGHAGEYAVVTRELTTASDSEAYRGLQPQWHVSVATVTRVQHGLWVLSGWQPEN